MLRAIDKCLAKVSCVIAALIRCVSCWRSGAGILVVRPGGMGDLIAAVMAMERLGVRLEDVQWLIEVRARPWAEFRGLNYSCYDRKPLQTAWHLWGRFAAVINTEQLYGLSQAYALLCAGRGGRVWKFSTNRGLFSRPNQIVEYDWQGGHEVAEFTKLFARVLGKALPLGTLERSRLQPISELPVIAIAGMQGRSRRLTSAQWFAHCDRWLGGRKCWVVAAPSDRALAVELVQLLGERAQLFHGDFGQICELIARSEEFFTMDGGMVHVASYFGVKTVALFTSGRAEKWAPLGRGSAVWSRTDLGCQPCTKFGWVPRCPHQFACKHIPLR